MTLALEPVFTLSNEQFQQLCLVNPELQLERTAKGELVIMPPTGGETGRQNANLIFQVQLWNHKWEPRKIQNFARSATYPRCFRLKKSSKKQLIEVSKYQLGEVFDASTGFILPNGATRSPDVSWLEKSRWQALTTDQREKFVSLCPDFVTELVSPSDAVQKTRDKMEEYRDNGCSFGILVNRKEKQAELYIADCEPQTLSLPRKILGINIFKDLVLDLT
ncbi:Uma2 family endonuclease [Picosynechococcus sp. PCC 11901]